MVGLLDRFRGQGHGRGGFRVEPMVEGSAWEEQRWRGPPGFLCGIYGVQVMLGALNHSHKCTSPTTAVNLQDG